MPEISKDLVAASSVPLILSILSKGESYGYEIIRNIKEASNGKFQFAEGTLYPILKKMEQSNWINAKWKTAENGRERKYYKITATGKKQLEAEKNNWQSVNQILQNLWTANFNLNMQ
ncbi:MAG: PadR family transcriptional regulator [Chitinophagaceae bacterium]|nr:PadR family transcriptional regulator [Chitinophagaceae bacterium]MCW5904280.1 PadR family transcriptional regulator [Chitinophagaceae bacterium]